MFNRKEKELSNSEIWVEAQTSAPLRMAKLLRDLKDRNWAPDEKFEKEWYEELSNLFTPLNLDIFQNAGESLFSKLMLDTTAAPGHEDKELIPILIPEHSGADYSLKVLSNDTLLTHSPATAGLVQLWSVPHCQETKQFRLYSRRSPCQVSQNGEYLATKTETGKITIERLSDGKSIKQWEHPRAFDGNSYLIEKFVEGDELVVSDNSNAIHFLSINENRMRTYPRMLVHNKTLLACSNDGRMLVTPEYGKRHNTVWIFKDLEKSRAAAGERSVEKELDKLSTFSSEQLPSMKTSFSPDGKYLVLTTPIELQIREYPFDKLILQMDLGRDIQQPALAISPDSKTLAVLRRSNPVELIFLNLQNGARIRRLELAGVFARHTLNYIEFAPNGKELLLAGKEKVYVLNVAEKKSIISNTLQKLVNTPIVDIDIRDLESLEKSYQNQWMSIYLRPWAEMLIYLVKRRSYDIAIGELEQDSDHEKSSPYDIGLA